MTFSEQEICQLSTMRGSAHELRVMGDELRLGREKLPGLRSAEEVSLKALEKFLPSQILELGGDVREARTQHDDAVFLHATVKGSLAILEMRFAGLRNRLDVEVTNFVRLLPQKIKSSFPAPSAGEVKVNTIRGFVIPACADALQIVDRVRGETPDRAEALVGLCVEFGADLNCPTRA